jgi:hypothetical protein
MGLTRAANSAGFQAARWIRNGSSGQYKSPGLNGNKAGASIFGRAARYTRNSSGRLRPEWVQRL